MNNEEMQRQAKDGIEAIERAIEDAMENIKSIEEAVAFISAAYWTCGAAMMELGCTPDALRSCVEMLIAAEAGEALH